MVVSASSTFHDPWRECAEKYFAGAADTIKRWLAPLKNLKKDELIQRCEEEKSAACRATGTDRPDICLSACEGKKADLIELLLASAAEELGPRLPRGGLPLCRHGFAVGYDVELHNPAWAAYRLRASEQRETDNARRWFVNDPLLSKAGIKQTTDADFADTGYDRGHLAPSLAMSFDRESWLESKTGKPGPWENSYFRSNMAPQAAAVNRQGWKSLEKALHQYAADSRHKDPTHDVFVITGLGYWNKANPLRVGKLVVPSFHWKVVCDLAAKGSFAVIADNSAEFDDAWSGWPPNLFKLYAPADVEALFNVQLGLPAACNSRALKRLLAESAWPLKGHRPLAELPMQVRAVGKNGKRLRKAVHAAAGEVVRVSLKLPFDGADVPAAGGKLRIVAPGAATGKRRSRLAHFTFDCNSLVRDELPEFPAGWSCDDTVQSELHLHWQRGPIKTGAFALEVDVKAPSIAPDPGKWTGYLESKGEALAVVQGTGFKLVIQESSHNGLFLAVVWLIVLALIALFVSCFGVWRRRRREQTAASNSISARGSTVEMRSSIRELIARAVGQSISRFAPST